MDPGRQTHWFKGIARAEGAWSEIPTKTLKLLWYSYLQFHIKMEPIFDTGAILFHGGLET